MGYFSNDAIKVLLFPEEISEYYSQNAESLNEHAKIIAEYKGSNGRQILLNLETDTENNLPSLVLKDNTTIIDLVSCQLGYEITDEAYRLLEKMERIVKES